VDSRFGRTAAVLRLALGAAVRALWLTKVRSRWLDPEAEVAAERELWAREGRRLREVATRQGGMLIKLGQFLSTRADVLPEEFTREVGLLQDVVPPVSWLQVDAILRGAYGPRYVPDVFGEFAEPAAAAASLAQVHHARLADGRRVAVKVLRPGIERAVRIDLDAVRIAVAWLQRLTSWGRRFDLLAIWQELRETTEQELDPFGEADRAIRFAANFKDDPMVSAPEVFTDLTRPGVLVLELVEGMKPDQLQELDRAGVDRAQLAHRLVSSYMKQWLVDGFFHADPHPGNIFIRPDGGIVYVDFGMMGELRRQDRKALDELVEGVIRGDLDRATQGLIDLGFVRPGADLVKLQRAFGFLLDRMLGTTFLHASGPEVEAFVREIRDFLYEHPFQIPARYTFLGRALGILAGIVAPLAPGENFVRLLMDGARQYVGRQGRGVGAGDIARGALRRLQEPVAQALRILGKLDRDDYRLRVDLDPLLRELHAGHSALRALTWAVIGGFSAVTAALVGSSSYVLRDLLAALAVLGLLTALLTQRRR